MIICGIDPGLSGALAFFDPATGNLDVLDMPTLLAGVRGKRILDEDAVARAVDIRSSALTHAFVELVGTRPGEGAVGAFSFGQGYGLLRGVLAAHFVPRTYVRPAVWKKALSVPAQKDGARARASELLPRYAGCWTRVKDDGRAEAAMIAVYGARVLLKGDAK
jgi:crossover junction endodeoxyribonuclease RuvC